MGVSASRVAALGALGVTPPTHLFSSRSVFWPVCPSPAFPISLHAPPSRVVTGTASWTDIAKTYNHMTVTSPFLARRAWEGLDHPRHASLGYHVGGIRNGDATV